jgi:hypothetical protein
MEPTEDRGEPGESREAIVMDTFNTGRDNKQIG